MPQVMEQQAKATEAPVEVTPAEPLPEQPAV